jgi:hypothetical protein
MVVVAHDAGRMKLDSEPFNSPGQAIGEDVIDGAIRTKQKSPAYTSSRHEIGGVWEHTPGQGHAEFFGQYPELLSRNEPRKVRVEF